MSSSQCYMESKDRVNKTLVLNATLFQTSHLIEIKMLHDV